MKKRLLLSMLFLAGMLCLTGCEQGQTKEVNASEQEESETPGQGDQEEEEDQDQENQESDQSEVDNSVQHSPDITVYYSNEDATAFDSEEIQMGSFSAENILTALVDKGVVTADVKILSLEVKEVDGKDTIEIDFNNAFASYISSMGTSGEYYIMGGVCNTFLDAYECDQIKITVEGGTLETGHAEYPGYMTQFS